jgi:hypothetical protein
MEVTGSIPVLSFGQNVVVVYIEAIKLTTTKNCLSNFFEECQTGLHCQISETCLIFCPQIFSLGDFNHVEVLGSVSWGRCFFLVANSVSPVL